MVSTLLSFVFLMQSVLQYIKNYVKFDLRRLDIPPAKLLSRKPMDDPLESIMYITSVGVPSVIYETVKNLRQARGYRLGAMQRKFPFLGIGLLYLLAAVELLAFPLLGAGNTAQGILSLQSILFGCLTGAHVLVLRIIQELWQASGGVFNVDEVLQEMVFGLEEELDFRMSGAMSTEDARAPGVEYAPPGSERGGYAAIMPVWASNVAAEREQRNTTPRDVAPADVAQGELSFDLPEGKGWHHRARRLFARSEPRVVEAARVGEATQHPGGEGALESAALETPRLSGASDASVAAPAEHASAFRLTPQRAKVLIVGKVQLALSKAVQAIGVQYENGDR